MRKVYKQHKRGKSAPEHYTKMHRSTMETEAWRALSGNAQAIYPWLKLEWKGPNANNNGKISAYVRQLGEWAGINSETAGNAQRDLQRKGFIVVTHCAELGVAGKANGHQYEITEIPLPSSNINQGRCLYKQWKPGADFEVIQPQKRNPKGGTPPRNTK
ncbi:hypothetical protein KO498_10665 [Lentibacter algarum]|uniref:hypothetical protein n=1 Tax=Lentibacter algarum TaxID=576131 RepID=UPI001C07C753|nr:hypothetical protein [Lentibacter algarum]MBU2982268.1 hypothetical protein [Lentibacter algarum]